MLRPLILVCVLLSSTAADAAQARERSFPCYWVRGRLMAYNGNPTFRIWPRGTHRLLGVINWDNSANKEIDLPPILVAALDGRAFDKEIWGNFRVCPRASERPGRMRPVDLVDARVLAVRDYGASRGT
jgi:hypothetical protein